MMEIGTNHAIKRRRDAFAVLAALSVHRRSSHRELQRATGLCAVRIQQCLYWLRDLGYITFPRRRRRQVRVLVTATYLQPGMLRHGR